MLPCRELADLLSSLAMWTIAFKFVDSALFLTVLTNATKRWEILSMDFKKKRSILHWVKLAINAVFYLILALTTWESHKSQSKFEIV